ncbi:MAG: guanylate kinase [Lachnospiraceae bacterium]|nr:guanylate kinase [Lachnospiraceae bacterium]
MTGNGLLFIVSGFSGAGKGTIMKELLRRYDNYALSVSATTRKPRPGEEHGKDYFFVSREEFEEMIRNDALIEYAVYGDNYYGTPKKYVEEMMAAGKDVILEIEVQGAQKIKEKMPETERIFVTPPSAEELRRRLTDRGSETEEEIEKRLRRAVDEAPFMSLYDYILVNDDLDRAVTELHALICAAHKKSVHRQDMIDEIKTELSDMMRGGN